MRKILLAVVAVLTFTGARALSLGEPYAVVCPECGKLMRQIRILAGNTVGAKHWSDAKMDAEMLPSVPMIIKCPGCSSFLFPADNVVRGLASRDVLSDAVWTSECRLDCFDISEAFDMIARKNRRSAYIMLWHAYNDIYRDSDSVRRDTGADRMFIKYIPGFLQMLDASDDNDRLLIAEIYRNTRNYRKCIKTLDSFEFSERFASLARQIRERAEARDSRVFLFDMSGFNTPRPKIKK